MRQLLFRGQTRRKGEKVRLDGTPVESNWVYGGVMQGEGDHSIIYQTEPEFHKYPVYSDTLGQFTGLTDKNGTKIFEGDIIVDVYDNYQGEIRCKDSVNEMMIYCTDGSIMPFLSDIDSETVQIIGNIYDNPELLNE